MFNPSFREKFIRVMLSRALNTHVSDDYWELWKMEIRSSEDTFNHLMHMHPEGLMHLLRTPARLWRPSCVMLRDIHVTKDGVVHVDGNVNWVSEDLKTIPIKFGTVKGTFTLHHNHLQSLTNCPTHVEGNFSCSINNLTSLEGAPKIVRGFFDCRQQESHTFSEEDVREVCQVNGFVFVD